MVKIVIAYPPPPDAAAFDAHYLETHIPLCRKLPGLRRAEVVHLKGAPDVSRQLYILTEFYFDDRDAMKNALKSPEMAACVADLKAHLPGSSDVYFSDDIQD